MPATRVSDHILHVGIHVIDRAAADRFYKDILGFRLMWEGGPADDRINWISLLVPDGTDWVEYMTGMPNPNPQQLGGMHHACLEVKDIQTAFNGVVERGYTPPRKPVIARDGRWLANFYDPDLTRTEIMIRKPVQTPCCTPLRVSVDRVVFRGRSTQFPIPQRTAEPTRTLWNWELSTPSPKRGRGMMKYLVLLVVAAAAWAATLEVRPSGAIQSAIDKAKAGDTIVVHAGTYRERVRVEKDGIVVTGAPGEGAVITGADVIPAGEWERVAGKPVWRHTPWKYRGPTHPNDDFHRLIGRTEQVIVDGKLLRQVLQPEQMEPGTFYADPGTALFVRLPGDAAPAGHTIEASVRATLMEITGSHVVVRHLRFVHASNPAQHAALDIAGADNLVEDCVAEWTNGVGARLDGERNTARRLVSHFNGQMGMGGHGIQNVMEECRLEGNNVKGYKKGWEAGGIKIAMSRGFVIRRCEAVRNDGPGFWFDIDNRDGLVEHSYSAENHGAGIFAEISETITIRNNLAVRNGLKDERGSWCNAGILLGEAMRCVVEHNISVGNRHGIEVRQQSVRTLEADPKRDRPEEKRYYSEGHVFRDNIAAFNREYQFAVFGDNPFFGAKKEGSPQDLELWNPDKRGWRAENNLYFAGPGAGLILWGAKWLPKHREYRDLKTFEAEHHLEQGSMVADPLFVNWEAGDFKLKAGSPAEKVLTGGADW